MAGLLLPYRSLLTAQTSNTLIFAAIVHINHLVHPFAMNQFVQRIANYIANEIFIKGLANSKTFQRFAVHTDRHIQKIKKEGVETLNSHMDEFHKQATKAAYSTSASEGAATSGARKLMPPQKPLEGVAGFFSALGKVIRRDLGMGK